MVAVIPSYERNEPAGEPKLSLPLTYTKAVSVDRTPPIQPEARVKRLIDDRVARSCEKMRELDGRGALVDHEAAHGRRVRGARSRAG